MNIRTATLADLESIAEIERRCFCSSQASNRAMLKERIKIFPQYFLLLQEGNKTIGFINGPVIKSKELSSLVYHRPSLHQEDGDWQVILGLAILPSFQHFGYGHLLLAALCQKAKNEHRLGVVLHCPKEKIAFYEEFGFKNAGKSFSDQTNQQWYPMRLTFLPPRQKQT